MNRVLLTTLLLAVCSAAFSQPQWIQHHGRAIPEVHEGLNGFISVDLNGDGWTDLVGGIADVDRVFWWENLDGQFEFQEHLIDDDLNFPRYVASGDMDGDGDPDLVAWAQYGHNLCLYLNSNQGTSWTKVILDDSAPAHEGIHLVDLDLDGDLDIVAGLENLPGRIVWYENEDNAGLGEVHEILYDMTNTASFYSCADLDQDGDQDFVVSTTSNNLNEIIWIENQDSAASWITHEVASLTNITSIHELHLGDIDNDGFPEIVNGSADGVIYWKPGEPGEPWIPTVIPTRPVRRNLRFADIDGDGDLDFADRLTNGNAFAWWEYRPGGNWRERQIIYSDIWTHDCVLTDINNDGATDMVVAQLMNGYLPCFENNLANADFSITVRSQHGFPIDIPRFGGNFSFRWTASNQTDTDITLDIWAEIWSPSGEQLRAFNVRPTTDIPAGWQRAEIRWEYVPENLPGGINHFIAHIGVWPDSILCADTLFVNKIPRPWAELCADEIYATCLTDAAVDCSPNPFNAMTTVRVALTEAAELNVVVYNLAGQQVAELLNGTVSAGSHAYTLDATNLASGLYFVRVVSPGQLDQTQKVMLVR